jgi:hypothetical protein
MAITHVPELACGFRQSGGIYATLDLVENGTASVEDFVVCPPVKIDSDEMGLSAIGTKLIEQNGVWHVLDIIGQDSYPNVADFLEEARRQGISRRISKRTEFSLLGPGSRLILAHAHGYIDNAVEFYHVRPNDEWWCPRDIPDHTEPPEGNIGYLSRECCSSLHWECVEGGVAASDPDAPGGMLCGNLHTDITGVHMHRRRSDPRAVVRTLPSFSYRALRTPEGVAPKYSLAVVASFPIGRLEVVRDFHGDSHEDALRKANQSRLEVSLEDE